MKYMILLFGDESQWDNMSEEDMGEVMQAHQIFDEWCQQNNVVIAGGEELQPGNTAKTFTQSGMVTDAPFLEIKEQIGGFYVIEVESAEIAEEAARRIPNHGAVELRPVVAHE